MVPMKHSVICKNGEMLAVPEVVCSGQFHRGEVTSSSNWISNFFIRPYWNIWINFIFEEDNPWIILHSHVNLLNKFTCEHFFSLLVFVDFMKIFMQISDWIIFQVILVVLIALGISKNCLCRGVIQSDERVK
jgi:hypothetical protein